MEIRDIENNYDYDNEGINELGYVKINIKLVYMKYLILFLLFNSYYIYFMLVSKEYL